MRTISITETNARKVEFEAFRWALTPDAHDFDTAKKKLKMAIAEELTETQKRYIIAYYVECKTMEQIGLDMGVNKSTVSRTIGRARRRLHKVLKYTNERFL